MNEEKEIPINLMIDAVFNNFNDDTELMARWLFKNGYINKNKDGNYIINKKYKPTFFTTKEIKEYDYAFRYLQQENTQLKRMLNIKEKFDKKEVPYEWEFKDMFDTREENDTLKQQLKDKDEKINKIEKLTKQLKGSARYERCMDELDYILNIIKED